MKSCTWRNMLFPRMSGLLDRLFRKVCITGDPGGALIHSGKIVQMQRRFDHYQSRVKERLLAVLHPLETELDQLLLTCENPTVSTASAATERTTGAIRAANAGRARRAELRVGVARSRARLHEILHEITYACARTDSQIDQALNAANASIAVYAKAAYFSVVEREIPNISKSFYANQVVDQELLRRARRVAGSEKEIGGKER